MSETQKKWIITTSDEHPLADVEKNLTEMGFNVEQSYAEIGSISGSVDEEAVEKLRSVPGVVDISPEEPIDIGPPDSPETW